ncbi:transcriptional regulator, XRE family [Pelodictyon luteolum DSM 273]|uniref:Transcriptional regulator, XRE family n=2 Tax=Pelodictyon luteolum TaxID=1100 RepID=Q3B526_CHLL3|nr:transcriptional regulator, XRE family [Pelodictyon luteolum DSM 273]
MKKQVEMCLGDQIRSERYRKNLSQLSLSQQCGLHRSYIGLIERGEKNITVINCMKVANALGISLSELIARVESSLISRDCLAEVS